MQQIAAISAAWRLAKKKQMFDILKLYVTNSVLLFSPKQKSHNNNNNLEYLNRQKRKRGIQCIGPFFFYFLLRRARIESDLCLCFHFFGDKMSLVFYYSYSSISAKRLIERKRKRGGTDASPLLSQATYPKGNIQKDSDFQFPLPFSLEKIINIISRTIFT